MRNTGFLLITLLLLLLQSCDEKQLEPITESMGKPQKVTDVQVEVVPGGAVISYRIPNVEDILGVKGVYTLSNGQQYEAMASFYENKLEVLG
ncbi:MAG: DUF4959 domain-containing protein, partial [Spirochaetia bacterium]|nr:DUF4959 domain-containing protein [Spirochaetia bacterium]